MELFLRESLQNIANKAQHQQNKFRYRNWCSFLYVCNVDIKRELNLDKLVRSRLN